MQQVQLTLAGTPLSQKPFRHITLNEQTEFYEFLEKLGVFSDNVNDEKSTIVKLFFQIQNLLKNI